MHDKVKSLEEIENILQTDRSKGKTIVHCHGVFDLLHPGHIRHFKEAKQKGDTLVVTLTPDRFVNKGPGRPAFSEDLRIESVAALDFVDYVVLTDSPDAVSSIQKIKPNIYVKGKEYKEHESDVTGKIKEEVNAVIKESGEVHYTDDIVFSSSSLLNQYFDSFSKEQKEFLEKIKKQETIDSLLHKIEKLSDLKVLIVGDAILDEYQYVEPLGKSAKGLHMTAACLDKELFLGGALIVANHVAQFTKNVTLITSIGKECPHASFIEKKLDKNIDKKFVPSNELQTLVKKRYVLNEKNQLSKLFETYSFNKELLESRETAQVVSHIQHYSKQVDLVLVCDFGNGFTNEAIIKALSNPPSFLAINTQMNSGNRGFNVITHYKRADFISVNEPEIRLAAHDRYSLLEKVIKEISLKMNCPFISVTRGTEGSLSFSKDKGFCEVPPFANQVIDRVGAGDSYLALASLCLAKKYSMEFAGFIGSIAAALDVQIVGNRKPIEKIPFCKYLVRLLK